MRRLLMAGSMVAIAAVGCASEAPGQPIPQPDGASTPASTSQEAGEAPPINSPELDLASYESRVCDLLAPAQLALFAIQAPGQADDGVAGPDCTWNPPDTSAGAQVSVTILSKAQNGWEGVYDRRERFPFFEEAGEINGYPAVHLGGTTIDVASGTCQTTVGVNRDVVFRAGVFVNVRSSPEYKDPCSVSDRVAGLVIDTLRGGR